MKYFFLALIMLAGIITVKAQNTIGPAEKRMTDSLCNALSHIDLGKINNKDEATAAFTECFGKYSALLLQVAEELKVDMEDEEGMHKVGAEIGKNLLRQNCTAFIKISTKMAGNNANSEDVVVTTGKLKRIDNKGFNYVVIAGADGKEKQFLWLRQFTGSEKFESATTALVGKNIKVTSKEMEVYLPQAKGYYKVKEITAIDIL